MEIPNIKKVRETSNMTRDEEYQRQLERVYRAINREIEYRSEDGRKKGSVKFWPKEYDRLNLKLILKECKAIYEKEGYKVKARLAFDYPTYWIFSLEW